MEPLLRMVTTFLESVCHNMECSNKRLQAWSSLWATAISSRKVLLVSSSAGEKICVLQLPVVQNEYEMPLHIRCYWHQNILPYRIL